VRKVCLIPGLLATLHQEPKHPRPLNPQGDKHSFYLAEIRGNRALL
jgi:hypothetical protein